MYDEICSGAGMSQPFPGNGVWLARWYGRVVVCAWADPYALVHCVDINGKCCAARCPDPESLTQVLVALRDGLWLEEVSCA